MKQFLLSIFFGVCVALPGFSQGPVLSIQNTMVTELLSTDSIFEKVKIINTKNIPTATVVKLVTKEAERIKEQRLSFLQSKFNATVFQIISGCNDNIENINYVTPNMLMKSLDYVQIEYPKEVNQFLHYRLYHSIIECFQYAGVSATLLFLCRFTRKKMSSIEDEGFKMMAGMFSLAAILGCFGFLLFGCLETFHDISKINNSPRIYIVEYISHLAKKSE